MSLGADPNGVVPGGAQGGVTLAPPSTAAPAAPAPTGGTIAPTSSPMAIAETVGNGTVSTPILTAPLTTVPLPLIPPQVQTPQETFPADPSAGQPAISSTPVAPPLLPTTLIITPAPALPSVEQFPAADGLQGPQVMPAVQSGQPSNTVAADAAAYDRTEAEYQDLARDPAQGGKITAKTEQERKVGLELEKRGDVPGKITRDPSGAAEFEDGKGDKWDVKGFNSNFKPSKGGFDLQTDQGCSTL